jgi:hypothetical protein
LLLRKRNEDKKWNRVIMNSERGPKHEKQIRWNTRTRTCIVIDYMSPNLQLENRNFRRRMPLATFWVDMDNSMGYNGSKVVSKFDKHHTAPTLFARLEPVRLLALPDVERNREGSKVSFAW